MNVLVTGGCGFLGSNLVAHYLAMGADVVVIDALFRKGSELNLKWLQEGFQNKNLSFYCKDLAEYINVEEVFRKHAPFDYICHLGGQVAMTTSLSDPRRDLLTNVVGTFNVLEAMRKHSPDALLSYSSTNKVYGDLEYIQIVETPTRYVMPGYLNGLDEHIPMDFASPYGCSKGAADQYVRDWCRNFGLKTVVFRHSSIYGGRQFATFDQGWIGWFCQKALEQKMAYDRGAIPECFTISGSGKQVRDVLHAEDLIRLYHLAWERRDCVAGEIFNIGGGLDNSLSLLELFDILEKLLDFDEDQCLRYEKLPRRQSDQDVFVADVAKASKLIGWSPQVDKQEGISKMISWTKDSIC